MHAAWGSRTGSWCSAARAPGTSVVGIVLMVMTIGIALLARSAGLRFDTTR
jgi:hypothetical protein